jgi:hypothetical protein
MGNVDRLWTFNIYECLCSRTLSFQYASESSSQISLCSCSGSFFIRWATYMFSWSDILLMWILWETSFSLGVDNLEERLAALRNIWDRTTLWVRWSNRIHLSDFRWRKQLLVSFEESTHHSCDQEMTNSGGLSWPWMTTGWGKLTNFGPWTWYLILRRPDQQNASLSGAMEQH